MGYKIILVLFFLLISTGSNGYSESGSTLFDNGIAEFQKGRYQDAIFWFTKLIEKEPFNAKAYKNRGVARLSLQKTDMAMENLERTHNPVLQNNEAYKKTMEDFNSALNLDPELEGIHSNMGVAWFYAGEYKKAIAEYGKEIEKFPKNHSSFFNRAISWVELNEYENALRDLQSVLRVKPNDYWAIAYQGDIYEKTNNPALARESYLAAMSLKTDNKYAHDRLLLLDDEVASNKTEQAPSFMKKSKKTETFMAQSVSLPKPASMKTSETVVATSVVSTGATIPSIKKKTTHAKFTIQLGAFLNSENADYLVKLLTKKGYEPRVLEVQDKKNRQWTLVRTGAFQTAGLAKETLEKVKKDLKVDAVVRPV
ncbi:MAG: SPOR domain-containing protein, partial [Desulfobacterium sp.]